MSDTILGGDFTVYYEVENRQKRVKWSGSATATRSVNELYSAMQDLFDELNQMDDGTPMSAQTPTEYTIGVIDSADDDPWFIDKDTVEHLYGGAIKTNKWARVEDSNTGIVKITCESGGFNIVEGDIGSDITHADLDSGVILDVNTSTYEVWVRPDDDAIGNSFNSAAGVLTVTGSSNTATQSGAAETGESLWANIYSIGTLQPDTHLYVYQGVSASKLAAYKGSDDWWVDDHFDVLINVKEVDSLIDEGYLTVFARQYSKTYELVGRRKAKLIHDGMSKKSS